MPFAKKSLAAYTAGMDAKQVLAKFGTQQAMARAFGVTKGAVSQWLKAGRLPEARAWQLKAGLVKTKERKR